MKIKKEILSPRVANLDSALRFYSQLLGFRVVSDYESEFGEVQSYGSTIALRHFAKSDSHMATMEGLSIGLEVNNLDSAISELESKGVVFRGNVIENGPARVAPFQDTDGELLHLSKAKKGIGS